MKSSTKEFLRTCGIALALMLALAAAFRAWMVCHPPPPRPSSAAEPFDPAAFRMVRAKQLLTRPLTDWTPVDRQTEPALAAWLADRAKVLLPWEWSDAARKKDPAGSQAAWRALLGGERKRLERLADETESHQEDCRTAADRCRTLHAHATNECVRLAAVCATNVYPAVVAREKLAKGRFWGWNRTEERVELPDAAAAAALLETIRKEAEAQLAAIRDRQQELQALEMQADRLRRAIAALDEILPVFQDATAADVPDAAQKDRALEAILSAIRATPQKAP